MQNLKKNFSLDCNSAREPTSGEQPTPSPSSASLQPQQQQQQRSCLAHSVSIVVELAKEAAQASGHAVLLASSSTDSTSTGCAEINAEGEELVQDEDEDEDVEDEEEEEEEEEEGEGEEAEEEEEEEACLSSDLARRVVLVDEADRILLRNRAQSAEPGALSACCRKLAGATNGARSPEQRSESTPPRPAFARPGLSPGASGGGGSSGELAERGELSQLGMRRYTHHHVNFFQSPGAAALVMRPLSATANKSADDSASVASPAKQQLQPQPHFQQFEQQQHHHPQQQQQQQHQHQHQQQQQQHHHHHHRHHQQQQQLEQQQFFKQHRRQSLQVSLLTSGHYYCCRDTSRSLTEEELRGEREFNEQVRSAARSPTHALRLAPVDGPLLGAAPGEQRQTSLRPLSGSQRARRVSFGSIDPIVGRAESGASSPARAQRASICCEQSERLQSGGILRKLERVSSSSLSTTASGQTATKRHSLASGERASAGQLASAACVPPAKRIDTSSDPSDSKQQRRDNDNRQDGALDRPDSSAGAKDKNKETKSGQAKRQAAATTAKIMGDNKPEQQATPTRAGEQQQQQQLRRQTRFASVAGGESAASAFPRQLQHQQQSEQGAHDDALDNLVASTAARKHHSKSIDERDARDTSRVQSIMASARLRQEEFAKLLEEHEQIVNEINRFETKISTTTTTATNTTTTSKQSPSETREQEPNDSQTQL